MNGDLFYIFLIEQVFVEVLCEWIVGDDLYLWCMVVDIVVVVC